MKELGAGIVASPPIVITDAEANSYLKIHGHEFLPQGVYNPVVHIMPGGVQGMADVNFDELNLAEGQSNDFGAKFLAMVFHGKQRVMAFGKVQAGDGKALVTIQNVQVGTTTLNDWLVNWLLQTYVESKHKIDLSKPLPLPDHVTQIELSSGKAAFVPSPEKKK